MTDQSTYIKELEMELAVARLEIKELAKDAVSGLVGRNAFETHLDGMFSQHRRDDRPIGILMADIDHFKGVNDGHGHRIGDAVLNRVGLAIKVCTRSSDIVARYGGDELVCILVNTDQAGLAILAERIRLSVEGAEEEGLPKVTISVGFALQNRTDTSGWSIVERADQALYRAKNGGRNRTEGEVLSHAEVQMLEEIESTREAEGK